MTVMPLLYIVSDHVEAPVVPPSEHLAVSSRSPLMLHSNTRTQPSRLAPSTVDDSRQIHATVTHPNKSNISPLQPQARSQSQARSQPQVRASKRGREKQKAAAGFPTLLLGGDPTSAGTSKKRKERDPNWSKEEILALVEAKTDEYLEEVDIIDPTDLMGTDVVKWTRIADKVNAVVG